MTPREQAKREQVRLTAAERFAHGDRTADIARDLRVGVRQVEKWRSAWRTGGVAALYSKGPMARERLSPQQWKRLEAELARGPLAQGWDDEAQGWTCKRIKVLIGRLFHIGYTVQGVWHLMRRHGWSTQVPRRRAIERDEGSIQVWKAQVWPQVKPPPRTWVPPSASPTSPGRG